MLILTVATVYCSDRKAQLARLSGMAAKEQIVKITLSRGEISSLVDQFGFPLPLSDHEPALRNG